MSGQTGKWREEQVLVICPGSSTTMAQLGCGELSPPAHRFPTRMFRDEETGQWRPYHTFKRKKAAAVPAPVVEGEQKTEETKPEGEKKEEDEWEYVEDQDSDEGAVYPIQGGHIVVMDAFLAFLEHVHSSLTTTYHNTPIMLMASPQWTRPDCETLARYIFEKTKTPALCLINSAIATQYGLKWPNMTVVDIGFEKVDVTCIYDSRIVAHRDVGAGWPENSAEEEREISGGEVFTRKLQQLLKDKINGFNRDMAEQLKKSNICEVLPYAPDKPKLMDLPTEDVPVAAVATTTTGAAAAAAASGTTTEGPKIVEPVADEPIYDAEGNLVDDEGVLDVANIVATGQTREFLAKKEKEKQEKAKKKGKDKEAEANRAMRLPNSKRVKNVFHFEEYVTEEVPIVQPAPPAPAPAPAAQHVPATTEGAKDVEMADAPAAPPAEGAEKKDEEKKDEAKTEEQKPDAPATEDKKPEEKPSEPAPEPATEAPQPAEAPKAPEPAAAPTPPAPEGPVPTERQTKRIRRDIEVGLERFEFADRAEIDRIVTAIYNAVQSIDDMYMRPPCWESLVFVGNGARIRGLKENILQTLQARHLISPSSATIFTSELPSNIGTPTAGTPGPGGASTPIASGPGGAQSGSLLQAATSAAAANANLSVGPGGAQGFQGGAEGSQLGQHHFHSQTPTNIKLAQLPTYLSEWTKNGFEEAMFLGAQVAARMAFCIHNFDAQGLEMQRYMSLSRVDYNELGPKGIRLHSMLGW
ncbi:hypothetical protein GE21DRAFT_6548 [Neurospora crassa]|uniref:Chromatin remodeling complex subunit n=1 Tax=Neurospora crassa (strain ATCC 24698 / 74-OR23-1A / CBS 708.71 / DSM 1257 / FGSC 987) TaxID=367110 RepID=Q7S8X5_NEUCR|nr:chromatin remodeling complex subunit [Neurospora crassa OR74A]EAA32815.1 chromatin remodeling complex subunit [Neurospora crassa OR74A]KHE79771.1 hypothetical protein GE21DRAFT_6548 [Neurospora crassa]|eukprot:XP_962051.1 chromatin remodeling complex subunit [Neurospora crassa OR74A]